MFMVFHLRPNHPDNFISCREAANAARYWNAVPAAACHGHYAAVAIVNTEDIEDAFRLTNNIDQDWQRNEEVTALRACRERSTSVGDVVMDMSDGRLHFCAPVGWEEMTDLITRKETA